MGFDDIPNNDSRNDAMPIDDVWSSILRDDQAKGLTPDTLGSFVKTAKGRAGSILKDNKIPVEQINITSPTNEDLELFSALTSWIVTPEAKGSSISQLEALPTIYETARQTSPLDGKNDIKKIARKTLHEVADNEENSPLVRIVAGDLYSAVYDDALERALYDLSGHTMGNRFKNYTPEKSDNSEQLQSLIEEGKLRLNDNDIFLLETAYKPEIKKIIDHELGVNLSKVSLEAQLQLLKFMTKAGDDRFDKLCQTLRGTDKDLRLKLAENFLAADFGEDFGDALLDIADSEHISSEQLEKILDGISSCRESIKGITGLYKDFDGGDFAKEYARAANERLTDAITVFREIAEKGEAKAVLNTWRDSKTGDITGQCRTRFDFDEAMEALNYEAKSLVIISGTVGDVIDGKTGAFAEKILSPDERHQRSMYNFYSPNFGYVLLYVRSEGSSQFEPSIEYGKFRSRYDESGHNIGTEASISMTTNPINPFSLPNPFRPDRRAVRNPNFYDSETMDKVSALRLDREGRTPGTEANDEARNPINKTGIVSVDLAAINDRADTPSGKIARLFSLGNRLRADCEGADFALNHNTRWFEQEKYGTEDGFAQLAGYVDVMANSLCEIRPPVDGESFTQLRQQSRKRRLGRKVLGEAA